MMEPRAPADAERAVAGEFGKWAPAVTDIGTDSTGLGEDEANAVMAGVVSRPTEGVLGQVAYPKNVYASELIAGNDSAAVVGDSAAGEGVVDTHSCQANTGGKVPEAQGFVGRGPVRISVCEAFG